MPLVILLMGCLLVGVVEKFGLGFLAAIIVAIAAYHTGYDAHYRETCAKNERLLREAQWREEERRGR